MSDFREVEPGVWSVLNGSGSYEIRIAGDEVRIDGIRVDADFTDPREWNPKAGQSAVHGSIQIKAPMPGKLIRVLVEVGQEVGAGQGIVIVEAMKMQNELKTPRAGKVSALNAREGETVNAGAVLAAIE